MVRKHRCISVVSRLIVLLAVLVLASSLSHAQVEKPFKISGEGVGPLGIPLPGQAPRWHWVVGNATHLGKHIGCGWVETASVDPISPPGHITGTFGSGIDEDGNPLPFEFRGANGDKLVCVYGRTLFGASEPGAFDLTILGALNDGTPIVEALWIAEFVPVPEECTGKFAGVTGSWIMFANSQPFVLGTADPVYYAWEGDGSLTFKKK